MNIARTLRAPAVRWSLLALTFGFIAWALSRQWADVERAAQEVQLQWGWIGLASVLVLTTYAVLIQSWRMLLAGWGGHLSYPKAAQIWTVANLGRYLPGKVWSVGALGLLASRAGVSGVAAAGAAVLGTGLNIGAGFAVSLMFGGELLDGVVPGLRRLSMLATVLFVLSVAVLPIVLPRLLDRFAGWRGIPLARQHLRNHEIWTAALINTAAWMGYGLAFACFARGVLPDVRPSSVEFTAIYAASYLVGFLALFSPGGLGFREVALSALLVTAGLAGQGDAAILGATSRVWLTVLEILPGLIGLAAMSPSDRRGLTRTDAR